MSNGEPRAIFRIRISPLLWDLEGQLALDRMIVMVTRAVSHECEPIKSADGQDRLPIMEQLSKLCVLMLRPFQTV